MTIDQFKSLPQPIQDDALAHMLALVSGLMPEANRLYQAASEESKNDTSGIQTSSDLLG